MQQATLKPMRGTEWMINRMVTELTNSAMDLAELTAGVDWSEWCDQEEQESKRSKKEELWLWKRLDECDRIEAKKEKVNTWKKSQKIEKARQRMGAGKSQPGIMSSFLKRAGNTARQSNEGADVKQKKDIVPDQGFTCEGRSGWKSSQGVTTSEVSGAVPSPEMNPTKREVAATRSWRWTVKQEGRRWTVSPG